MPLYKGHIGFSSHVGNKEDVAQLVLGLNARSHWMVHVPNSNPVLITWIKYFFHLFLAKRSVEATGTGQAPVPFFFSQTASLVLKTMAVGELHMIAIFLIWHNSCRAEYRRGMWIYSTITKVCFLCNAVSREKKRGEMEWWGEYFF